MLGSTKCSSSAESLRPTHWHYPQQHHHAPAHTHHHQQQAPQQSQRQQACLTFHPYPNLRQRPQHHHHLNQFLMSIQASHRTPSMQSTPSSLLKGSPQPTRWRRPDGGVSWVWARSTSAAACRGAGVLRWQHLYKDPPCGRWTCELRHVAARMRFVLLQYHLQTGTAACLASTPRRRG